MLLMLAKFSLDKEKRFVIEISRAGLAEGLAKIFYQQISLRFAVFKKPEKNWLADSFATKLTARRQ